MTSTHEETLPESDQELREFLDHATVGLRWVGPDGRILWANRAELDLVGYSESEYVGQPIATFFVQPETAADILGRLAREESVRSYETRLRAKDGSIKQVLIDGSGLFRGGRHVHSRLVTRDLTSLMEREQGARHRAEATSHLKDEFLALLSHELRTPLGAILIWSQLLRNEKMDEAGTIRALGMIERSTKTLAKLIDDLLDVSRIIAGKLRLDARPMHLGPVIDAALEAVQPDVDTKGLRIERTLPTEPVSVSGDPVRMQQIVGNLLSNAVKFTPEGGRVTIVLETSGHHARIRVTDTGAGLKPDFLPFIFERFRQADTTSTRGNKGLGLGLAISRHLVELHGGMIEATSPGEGLGSTFTVTVPMMRAAADVTAQPAVRGEGWPAERGSLDGVRVLVVDDESDARDALALVLERCGASVTVAASAPEALAAWRREPHDVLLSDIAMPGEDGYSLIRKITSTRAGKPVPAAAVTAYATSEDRQRALEAGYRDHLSKPVDPGALVATVARLAGRTITIRPTVYPLLRA
jgi:PAS domain S-box-containing protein